ncbi:fasciclin-like arabinogalactan protein 10 [Brachypodium distachyon]|uniref:FAS1 domain-containing protein n=1 Tax=Brachypodium distachyon TaxID=15368 RepID=I1HZZ7_BRADI|nr:fasciclin-like arabinogalactan protein 10 [Brachypodium distachyon]KQJ94637.1 hypothetical protein BRADI_3g11800v3 [Brachypodium distachyon]|eukprot:XP_003571258.1 fasciclin-like arabinogalactan protein 10 [Brachypodium distachyon]
MAFKILLPLLLLAAATPTSVSIIDVAQMLAGKPQYATFVKLLTETKVAEDVSRLKSASVLVVSEKNVKALLSVPKDKLQMILSHHVLLKYFDPIQLNEMKTPTAKLESMLSTTDKNLGTIMYSKDPDGQMYLRSPGADTVAKLVKVVAARPFAVSIMEISAPLVSPEILAAAGAAKPKVGKGKAKGKGKVKPMSANDEGSSDAAPSEAPTTST